MAFPFHKKHTTNNLISLKFLSQFPHNLLLYGRKVVLITTSLDVEYTTRGLTCKTSLCILGLDRHEPVHH